MKLTKCHNETIFLKYSTKTRKSTNDNRDKQTKAVRVTQIPVCKRTRRNGGSTDVVRPSFTGADQTDVIWDGPTGPEDVVSLAGTNAKLCQKGRGLASRDLLFKF